MAKPFIDLFHFDFLSLLSSVACPDPGNPQNGQRVGNDFSGGGTGVLFICRSGYRLVGQARLRCQLTGVWSAPRPRCGESQ